MDRKQVAELAAKGHIIGCHTWDHHMVTKYTESDWVKQIEKPWNDLKKITNMPVKYFAYPFGLWNTNAVEHIKKYGFTAAFQLAKKTDKTNPLFTVRRIIADGNATAPRLIREMKADF